MIVVNLYGSPGAGKSTGAAYIFSKLKMAGVNAELVTEFAKDMVWDGSTDVLEDQIYVFGQQYHRLKRLETKVDVVITDSPILLGMFYCTDNSIKAELQRLMEVANQHFNNWNYFVLRDKPYNPTGRLQTEAESERISHELKHYLIDNHISFDEVYGCQQSYDQIVTEINTRLCTSFRK